jgi:hypothetical protein
VSATSSTKNLTWDKPTRHPNSEDSCSDRNKGKKERRLVKGSMPKPKGLEPSTFGEQAQAENQRATIAPRLQVGGSMKIFEVE